MKKIIRISLVLLLIISFMAPSTTYAQNYFRQTPYDKQILFQGSSSYPHFANSNSYAIDSSGKYHIYFSINYKIYHILFDPDDNTWTLTQVKVGNNFVSDRYNGSARVLYDGSYFHLFYAGSYYDYDDGEYNIYYTSSTDPTNFPDYTIVGSEAFARFDVELSTTNIPQLVFTNRVRAYYADKSTNWNKVQLGGQYSRLHGKSIYFNGPNTVYVQRENDGNCAVDKATRNGSSWTYNEYYWPSYPDDHYVVKSNKYVNITTSYPYSPIYNKGYSDTVYKYGRDRNDDYYYQYLYVGSSRIYLGKMPSSRYHPGLVIPIENKNYAIIFQKCSYTSGNLIAYKVNCIRQITISSISNPTTNSLTINSSQTNIINGANIEIQKSLNSNMSNYSVVASYSTDKTTSRNDVATGLIPGTKYYFRIKTSFDNADNYSPVVGKYTLCSIPNNITFDEISSKSLRINFSNNLNGADTTYYIERSLTGNPSGTDWEVIYEGPNTSYTESSDLTPKTTYYYRVRGKNPEGQYSGYSTITSVITSDIDRTAPVATLTANNDEYVTYSKTFPISVIIGDNATPTSNLKYSYSVNNSVWTTLTNVGATAVNDVLSLNITHNLTTSGELTFKFKVVDEDGNSSFANSRLYYQKPEEIPTPPETVELTDALQGESLEKITLNGQDMYVTKFNSVEIDMRTATHNRYRVKVNNDLYGDLTQKSEKLNLNLLNEGTHRVKIQEVNDAGIPGKEKTLTILVDKTPPTARARFIGNKSATRENTVDIKIVGKDNLSTTLKYRIDGGEWEDVPLDGIVTANLVSGLNELEIDIADQSLNFITEVLMIWKI